MRTYLALVLLAACGGNDTPSNKDSGVTHDSRPIDSQTIDAAGPIDAPPGMQTLVVKNYLSWCSVSVNGHPATIAASQTINVTPGVIPMTATPASAAFALGPKMWHHTTGDTTGAGEDGTVNNMTSAATATVPSTGPAKCVWVCCPFTSGTGCEPATIGEQCP